MTKTIYELINTIKREIPYIGIKPYSDTIIGLCLRLLNEEHNLNNEQMNQIIIKLNLNKLGWDLV